MTSRRVSRTRPRHKLRSRPNSRPWHRLLRPMFSTTTLCATTTPGKTIWQRRNFPTTSSFIPRLIWPATHTSTWRRSTTSRAIFRPLSRTTTRCCRIFPAATKRLLRTLKKGLALIELGQNEDGIAELKHVVQRYPHTTEALQAREKLRKLAFPAKEGARQ